MGRLKIFRWAVLACIVVLAAIMVLRITARPPALRDGDLIFQSSHSGQSTAIFAATHSLYTHMGIIAHRGAEIVVIEAAGPVRETPLKAWVRHGRFGRYAVFRRNLSDAQTTAILKAARALEGRPYDLFFSFDNRAIYCSELPFIAYCAAGIDIGRVQKVADLHIGGLAKGLIDKRWRSDPDCAELDTGRCYDHIMQQSLITPVAISRPVVAQDLQQLSMVSARTTSFLYNLTGRGAWI